MFFYFAKDQKFRTHRELDRYLLMRILRHFFPWFRQAAPTNLPICSASGHMQGVGTDRNKSSLPANQWRQLISARNNCHGFLWWRWNQCKNPIKQFELAAFLQKHVLKGLQRGCLLIWYTQEKVLSSLAMLIECSTIEWWQTTAIYHYDGQVLTMYVWQQCSICNKTHKQCWGPKKNGCQLSIQIVLYGG